MDEPNGRLSEVAGGMGAPFEVMEEFTSAFVDAPNRPLPADRWTPAAAVRRLFSGDASHSVAVDPASHHVFFPLQVGPKGTPALRIMRPAGR